VLASEDQHQIEPVACANSVMACVKGETDSGYVLGDNWEDSGASVDAITTPNRAKLLTRVTRSDGRPYHAPCQSRQFPAIWFASVIQKLTWT
jgi:hypothetical protein